MTNSISHKKTFFILTASQIFSKFSDRALLVGVSWYLVSQYSEKVLSIYLTFTLLPHLIMTLFSAKIINKYSPISVMRFSEFFRSLFIGLLMLGFLFAYKHMTVSLITLFVLLSNFFAAIFNPALLTVPKQLDLTGKQYQRITGLLGGCASISRMLGPMMVMPIYSYFGIAGVLVVCCSLYFFAWVTEIFIENRSWIVDAPNIFYSRWHYLKTLMDENSTVLVVLSLFFVLNILVIPIQLFMPLFVKDIFNTGLHLLTLFEMSLGMGLLLGGIFVVLFPLNISMHYRISMPYVLASIFYFVYSLSSFSYFIALVGLLLFGFFLAWGNVVTLSYYQQCTNKNYSAHIVVLVNLVSNASGPVGMLVAGVLLMHIKLQYLVSLYSLLALFIASFIFFVKDLKVAIYAE